MLTENHFIPFSPGVLPKGSWLVFAPHSDDETFGMGGSLLLARQQKIETNLIILTDGALGGKHSDLMNTRRKETEQIANILKIKKVEFWQNPDRGLSINCLLVDTIINSIHRFKPQNIFFPSISEFHPDHRASAFLVWEAIIQSKYRGEIFSYEIGSQQQPVNLLIDISSVFEEKKQLMKLYKSQLTENNYDDIIIALNKSRTYTLAKQYNYAEAFYQFNNCHQELNTIILQYFNIYFNPIDNIQTLSQIHFNNFQNLFEECFEHTITFTLWHWKYQLNTAHSLGYWKNSQLIGHYGGFARDILYFGHIQKAIQIGDTMVARKERANFTKNGVFHQLARIFLQRFIGYNAPYLIGFGFPNSRVMKLAEKLELYQTAGHIVQLSWQATNTIEPHLLYKIRFLSMKDEATVTTLWNKMANETHEYIIGIRDWKRIKYRYLQHPEVHFDVLKVCHRFTNKPIAVIILKQEETQYQLIDFICALKHIPQVIQAAIRFTQKANKPVLYTLISNSMKHFFTDHSFIETDPQITIPHCACTKGPALNEVKNKWWLMAGDSDFM